MSEENNVTVSKLRNDLPTWFQQSIYVDCLCNDVQHGMRIDIGFDTEVNDDEVNILFASDQLWYQYPHTVGFSKSERFKRRVWIILHRAWAGLKLALGFRVYMNSDIYLNFAGAKAMATAMTDTIDYVTKAGKIMQPVDHIVQFRREDGEGEE